MIRSRAYLSLCSFILLTLQTSTCVCDYIVTTKKQKKEGFFLHYSRRLMV